MPGVVQQLELLGLEKALRHAEGEGTDHERRKARRRVETAHELLSELPTGEDLSFLHSGLCQTTLPHSRPTDVSTVWSRQSGHFSLSVTPGVVGGKYVGVPYGSKARLILIHLQTEGLKSRTVSLGASLSAFMRSLGLAVTGGPRGTISAVREQALRIARCSFTMEWKDDTTPQGQRAIIADTRIVDGLELWRVNGEHWTETVELSERFHLHLREHAVPLDKRGIAHLSGNSLGLDLYALFAYRLPRLSREAHLRWAHLQAQIGAAEKAPEGLARRIREVLPDVMVAYPHARVEVTSSGLLLRPSPVAVPKASVRGYRLISKD
jgi:Plasmid encoded RepA protein